MRLGPLGFCRLLEWLSSPQCPSQPQQGVRSAHVRGKREPAMPRILSIFLPQLLVQNAALHGAEWLFVKHALFTQTPLLPAGRLRKRQRKGGSRGGETRGAHFSLAAINGHKSSTLCAQLLWLHQCAPLQAPEGPPTSSPTRPWGP